MDFPEGTCFQKLREIGLAGQERRNAASTHILWKTTGNGILTATLGAPHGGVSGGLTGHHGPRYTTYPLPVQTIAPHIISSFSLTNKTSRCTYLTQKKSMGLKNLPQEKFTHLCTFTLWGYPTPSCKYNSNGSFPENAFPSVEFLSAVPTMGQIWPSIQIGEQILAAFS